MRKNLTIILMLSVQMFSVSSCLTNDRNIADDNERTLPVSVATDSAGIFPFPKDIQLFEGAFIIDSNTVIIVPEENSSTDSFTSGVIISEFSDNFRLPVKILHRSSLPERGNFILAGDIGNPLVKAFCRKNGLSEELDKLGEEGYILTVTDRYAVVVANNGRGALYGVESLLQLIREEAGSLSIQQMLIKDSPLYPFRGIKLYLPGRDNITFFKRFIRDFVARYKFNTIVLELNANMRLEKHPELNIGTVEFKRHLDFSRLGRPPGQHMEYQNSSHQDNADGDILEKEEVADIVNYIRKFNIEVIPELPSLTHSYYLLFGHESLAENLNQPYPDTYCPLKPEIYEIYFDVLDEYIEVINPAIIHIGHDEWRMEKDVCELCRGKDYGELYAGDLRKIYDYLAKKGVKTAIWGDHLLESVTQKDHRVWKSSAGYEYRIPGALRPEQVSESIPKDILIFNWFWDNKDNDRQLSDFGFQQVYGNLRPDIENWDERKSVMGVSGGAPSSWAATTEMNIGKDQLLDFLGCANLLWSEHYLTMEELTFRAEPMIRRIFSAMRGKSFPSDEGGKVTGLDIRSHLNSNLESWSGNNGSIELRKGTLSSGNMIFNLPFGGGKGNDAAAVYIQEKGSGPVAVTGIQVNSDVNSILFLHASAREGNNKKAYDEIYAFDETSELLGWYEVIYEDGFVETIPVRYGTNILDLHWKQRIIEGGNPRARNGQSRYAYMASAVDYPAGNTRPLTFFAYEWVNPRFGKVVKEINLKSVKYGKDNDNAIILLAVSIVENRKGADAEGTERF